MVKINRTLVPEQLSRNANLEIKGVPVEGDENFSTILTKLDKSTGETSPYDIEVCHRVPGVKPPPTRTSSFRKR